MSNNFFNPIFILQYLTDDIFKSLGQLFQIAFDFAILSSVLSCKRLHIMLRTAAAQVFTVLKQFKMCNSKFRPQIDDA